MAMETLNGSVKRQHVLIVDDDLELVDTYQSLLEAHDYQASTASNGVEALKFLRNHEVDVILCDIDMPELTGDLLFFEVCRTWPQLKNRFIVVTGNAGNPAYENFLKSTKVPLLAKPVSIDRMLAQLQSVLGCQAQPSV
jgi:CheY-like chemotaxis protein